MGTVYEATDERDGKRVALKVMRAEFTRSREALTRFFNEARATNLVEHPGLVRIYEHGQATDGTAYLAMELLQGETLGARLRRYRGPMSEVEARRIGWQLASGLAAAHKKSIVHRDLKPGNIMLVPDPVGNAVERVKLLDFGIAKLDARSLNLEDPLTRTGALMGTPHYMSPEQCRGARGVDDRADVYSLAVIMFQMLAGRLPFIGDGGEGTVMAMHIYEAPPKLRDIVPSVSEPIQELILQMMRKEPEARPSMFLVTRRLEELGATVGLNSELSITLEDAPQNVRGAEPETVVAPPLSSAANTVLISGSAHQSFPSQPSTLGSLTGQMGQPSTLGPITGQVSMIPRFRRPILAGAIGAVGVVGVILMAVALLRYPSPPSAGTMTDNLSATAAFGVSGSGPGSDAPPIHPPESKDAANVKDAAGPKTSPKGPGGPGAAAKVPSKASGNKGGGKRHIVKHKPSKAKPKPSGKKPSSSGSSVSVVD